MEFFIDTYGLIEIVRGNKNYEKFTREDLFTSILNLYELCFYLIKNFNESTARYFFDIFEKNLIEIRRENILEAVKIKLKNSEKKLSYADCLGYAVALNYEMKFLTGDREFENFENVEFVR